VVISEAALADAKRKADRARIAQTIPAQTRSAPSAAPVPFTVPVSTPAAALLDDIQTPPRRRSAWPIALGGLVAVAAGVALVTLPGGGGSADKRALTTADSRPAAASPATFDAAPATTTASAPPQPAAIAEPTPSAAPPIARAAPAPIKRRPAKKPSTAVAAPRKSTSSRSLSAGEPTSTVSPRTGKGLIVRETPF
jgi:hypothetical protein